MSSTARPEQNARTAVIATPLSEGNSLQQSTVSITPSTSKHGGDTAATLVALRNNKPEAAGDANTQMTTFNAEPSTSTAPATPTVLMGLGAMTETTDSDDGASDWAEAHSPNLYASGSEVSNTSGKRGAESAPRPKTTSGVKKVVKRARANSTSSSTVGATATKKKRVRTTALQRQAPSAQSNVPLGNGELANFTATIFIIQLGPKGHQFHAHESVLVRSPKLQEEIAKAKANKRSTKQNILPLMSHDPVAFEQMLQYLYKDKFQLSKTKASALARIKEIHELMSLAKHYVLPGLQKQIVKLFAGSKILSKITAATFFDWAEDMYYEELDHENGAFKNYLARVGPMLIKHASPELVKDLGKMVKMGGGFAEELFKASHEALAMYPCVKKEEAGPESSSGGEGLFVDSHFRLSPTM